jgi:pyruvate, water dikinase
MSEKRGKGKDIDFVKWFSELNKDSGNVVGGKGANLAEIYNLKVPVPSGFVVTAQAYDYFIEKSGVEKEIKKLLEGIHYEDTKQLNEITTKIRSLIEKTKMPSEMEKEILESYGHLDAPKGLNTMQQSALDLLNHSSNPIFVAVRSSATTEDLAEASFAGQQDTYLNIKGNDSLIKHVKKCFASLFTARATYYRNKQGFTHEEASLAVVVQEMIDSDKSGVMFSKDPAFKNENTIIESVYGLGEGIVSGKITPDRYVISPESKIIEKKIADKKLAITRDSGGNQIEVKLTEQRSKTQVLKTHEIHRLTELALKLEKHYKKPQDIEFAIEGEEIYIVQTRPITTIEKRVEKGADKEIDGEVILEGLGASSGIAVGKVKIIQNLEDLHKIEQGDILVTKMTNPDMVVSMAKAAGIVTDEGGLTAHAAIVSREMGIPAIVGTQKATTTLKEGDIITMDGSAGKIYQGKTAETTKTEIKPVTAQTKTEIKVTVDLPSFAERAAKTNLKKVGLTRIEGIIAESGKHPNYFLKQNKIKDYEEVIFKGIQQIANYFEEMWIRTSDIRSDEFQNLEGAPQEKEANPMLGYHGIRYSLKNPEILKAELNALKRISEKGKKIGILMPQLISVDELKKVKEYVKEIGFDKLKMGIMIETPAAVQIIDSLCKEGIDFISFGTNDLTQYMLAIDRGNEDVQYLYDEMHPAILYQLGYVIRVCKRNNVKTSICGQAGSKKEMVKYLIEKGIESISVNADVAAEIAEYAAEIEQGLVNGTDKEPRNYQPKKETQEEPPKESENNQESKIETKEVEEMQEKAMQETPQESEERIRKDVDAIEEERKESEVDDKKLDIF